jgi:cell division protein FtsW
VTTVTPRLGLQRLTKRVQPRFVTNLAHRVTQRKVYPRPPAYVIVCATVGVLNIVGLVMILSASSVAALSDYGSSWYFFNRQFIWAVVGFAAFVAASRVDYHVWRKLAPALLLLSISLLVLVLIPGIGIEVDGSRRWLGWGPMRLQPSELAKVALLVYGAEFLVRRHKQLDDWLTWRPLLLVLGTIGALVVLEPDLDSTVVLALIALALVVLAGAPSKKLLMSAGLGIAGAMVLAVAAPYRRARVFAFLHPSSDTSNTGYQISQSLIALGSGGVNGVGLGEGRAKWLFLPNAHTDFIFAIIGEELGFVGCMLVLGLFAGFGLVGFHVARNARDLFGTLLAGGITVWIVGQAAINLGAVVGVLPVSGITLPFLSAGGSSLVIVMLAAGILANIARQAPVRRPVR